MAKIEEIDAVLPQTQCQECGYAACLPYAEAIVRGEADISECAPGGLPTLEALANLMHVDAKLYQEKVVARYRAPSVAVIDESLCIGCLKCIQACPVDAIIGGPKMMHTVLADYCTGCELCLMPCPTDCIRMEARNDIDKTITPEESRQRYQAKTRRMQSKKKTADNKIADSQQAQRDYIEAARLRVSKKKGVK